MIDPLLKKKLTDMLGWFHNFCVEHNIRYYLIEGTMLGAARHRGFIPWDDDIDVGVPRSDYERLMELLSKQHGDYVGESPKFYDGAIICAYGKLYHTGTTLIEDSRLKLKKGIYIDIFPLDGCGNTLEEGVKNLRKIAFLDNLLAARACSVRKGRSFLKNAAAVAGKLLPINEERLVCKIDKLCAKLDYDKYKYVGCLVSSYREKEIMPKSFYGKPTLYDFEGMQVYGVENAESYLTYLYGDWRKLPPEEDRISLHQHIYLNLNESYLEEPDGVELT